METEYDRKFEEMKKYIPFLDSMIRRLESTGDSNPRQAQLSKIKALRDLLLDRSKRMKMENLLKCEQVLLNLYAKVEQKDTLPGIQSASEGHETKSELETVRQKLKKVASEVVKPQTSSETLPEIARASQAEVVVTPGSKEPALFHRRPYKPSNTYDDYHSSSRRNYTRVLVSPERDSWHWSSKGYQHKSPRKSPKRLSPNYHKRDKRSSNYETGKSSRKKSKNLNITLKVPEERLKSLNTENIFDRIINCDDNDVDIGTLRDLRKQILGELKDAGESDDISDLILKNYANKNSKVKQKTDVEEGEISESEPDTENIYGNLILTNDKGSKKSDDGNIDSVSSEDITKKIQISLVISNNKATTLPPALVEDDDILNTDNKEKNVQHNEKIASVLMNEIVFEGTDFKCEENNTKIESVDLKLVAGDNGQEFETDDKKFANESPKMKSVDSNIEASDIVQKYKTTVKNIAINSAEMIDKPAETVDSPKESTDNSIKENIIQPKEIVTTSSTLNESHSDDTKNRHKIPLICEKNPLDKPSPTTNVSEIDILQALKNDILNESIDIKAADVITPPLHQPKLTKVSNVQEISKKKISIDKYKENKSSSQSSRFSLAVLNTIKQTRGLTEKECERFKLPPRLSLDTYSSDDENKDEKITEDKDQSLVPRSPDGENSVESTVSSVSPVIIPIDPVNNQAELAKSDIDMRTMLKVSNKVTNENFDKVKPIENPNQTPRSDPRIKRDFDNNEKITPFPNITPNPLIFTPSHNLELNEQSHMKPHVYAPSFVRNDGSATPLPSFGRIDCPATPSHPFGRGDCPSTPSHPFGRSDCPSTPSHPFGMSDCPTTPIHPFGRADYSAKSSKPFSRSDCPTTPVHPFGRTDYHSQYGRNESYGKGESSSHRYSCESEKPRTPSHSFGNSDYYASRNRAGYSDDSRKPSHYSQSDYSARDVDNSTKMNDHFRNDKFYNQDKKQYRYTEDRHKYDKPFYKYDHEKDLVRYPNKHFYKEGFKYDRDTKRETSIGRNRDYNQEGSDRHSSSYRADDVGSKRLSRQDQYYAQTNSKYDPTFKVSVEPFAGQTFSINTRVNSSFQNDGSSTYESNFSRNRASSVGRSLVREKSMERSNEAFIDRYVRDANAGRFNREPSVGRMTREPSVGRMVREPSVGRMTREPSVGRMARESSLGRTTREPSVGRMTREASVGRTTKDPNLDRYTRESSVGRHTRETSVGRYAGESSVERFTRETSLGRSTEETTVRSSMLESSNRLTEGVSRSDMSEENPCYIRDKSSIRAKAESFVPGVKRFYTNKTNFEVQRAKSVTREIPEVKTCRADEPDIKNSTREKIKDSASVSIKFIPEPLCKGEQINKKDSKEEKLTHQQENKNEPYSPRKNLRDPRVRRNQESTRNENKNNCKSPEKKRSGIVYTNDNIAKGNILSRGYGVMNYKIPKIKRPVEEVPLEVESPKSEKEDKTLEIKLNTVAEEKIEISEFEKTNKRENITNETLLSKKYESVDKTEPTKNATALSKKQREDDDSDQDWKSDTSSQKGNKNKSKKVNKQKYTREPEKEIESDDSWKSDINSQVRRSPRVQRKSFTTVLDSPKPKRSPKKRNKKAMVLDDISSDDMCSETSNISKLESSAKIDKESIKNLNVSHLSAKNTNVETLNSSEHINDDDLDYSSYLSTDDMDVFPEIPTSDNVIDNISELIADLDNDIRSSKDEPISVEKAFDDLIKDLPGEQSNVELGTVMEIRNENESLMTESVPAMVTGLICTENVPVEKTPTLDQVSVQPFNSETAKNNNEATSTSSKEEEVEKPTSSLKSKPEDNSSTPDSTIDTEIHSESANLEAKAENSSTDMNPDVSSTHSEHTKTASEHEPTSIDEPKTSKEDSLGSILTLLQDKSKLKQLMSMLDNQEDSAKLKKKLEKLSEIVSDDELETESTNKILDKSVNEIVENAPEETMSFVTNKTNENLESEGSNEKDIKEMAIEEKSEIAENYIENEIHDESHKSEDDDQPLASAKTGKAVTKTRKARKKAGKPKTTKSAQGVKRVTRSVKNPKNRGSRELLNLQADLRDMFMSEEVLNATGIRMCRLAKIVDDKTNESTESPQAKTKKNIPDIDMNPEPLVVLDKFTNINELNFEDKMPVKKGRKTVSSKQFVSKTTVQNIPKYKPGPKSKTKKDAESDKDPYYFDTDTMNDAPSSKTSDQGSLVESESEVDTFSSSSFGSTEHLVEVSAKKKKRKRGSWKTGVITKKMKKKVTENITNPPQSVENTFKPTIPDTNCFIDTTYYFSKGVKTYDCRLCDFSGEKIVHHYKNEHPHYEIPLSRMSPKIANEAISQSMVTNFQAINKAPIGKYVCRFCFKIIMDRRKNLLECFFWHVVSNHTGEYKHKCSECVDDIKCTFMLDIPPPPTNMQGLLMGYICGRCKYTQVSLENLKNHVSTRHNDEETEVYTISLGAMTQNMIKSLTEKSSDISTVEKPRKLRSSQTHETDSDTNKSPSVSPVTSPSKPQSIQSKINFENDESTSQACEQMADDDESINSDLDNALPEPKDFNDSSHFKISMSDSGKKNYLCCIDGDNHYRTQLTIHMKKHLQIKHKTDKWDGYCALCKLFVMAQGGGKYIDCWTHYLDKHMEDFPIVEYETAIETNQEPTPTPDPIDSENVASVKTYIKMRPMSELIDQDNLPKIESVVSLNTTEQLAPVEPLPFNIDVSVSSIKQIESFTVEKQISTVQYEEFQEEIISKKHRIVLEAMLTPAKLVHIFKCSGAFCSFTTNSAEEAIIHASTHQKNGNEDSLRCCYCSYDVAGNTIDLVSHVFKEHGCCQFVCKSCFYRATESFYVEAHHLHKHGKLFKGAVLKATVSTPLGIENNLLEPKEAVKLYHCPADIGSGLNCSFKTYHIDTFISHLSIHKCESYECKICQVTALSPKMYTDHLSTIHGLDMYQCVWCVYGAISGVKILAHYTAKHPTKTPKAYLRVKTDDENTDIKMCTRLVNLSVKNDYDPVEVVPNVTNENSVKEAERAMELEKLIGHTHRMLEGLGADTVQTVTLMSDETEEINKSATISESQPVNEPLQEETAETIQPVKSEPIPVEPSSAIICLDSDEEDAPPPATDELLVPEQTATNDSPTLISWNQLYRCIKCVVNFKSENSFKKHILACLKFASVFYCAHCEFSIHSLNTLCRHLLTEHGPDKYVCSMCDFIDKDAKSMKEHFMKKHGLSKIIFKIVNKSGISTEYLTEPDRPKRPGPKRKKSINELTQESPMKRRERSSSNTPTKIKRYGPDDIASLPLNEILDDPIYCSLCEYNTKVKLNMKRHLLLHAQQQPVAETAPINPVPHLETNQMHFDKMLNLASSSLATRSDKPRNENAISTPIPPEIAARYPKYVPERKRFACGSKDCDYISVNENMLKCHWETLHAGSKNYHCVHCPQYQQLDTTRPLTATRILAHLKMHDSKLYACSNCSYYHHQFNLIEKHVAERHKGQGLVRTVRDLDSQPAAPPANAPTMDLKPWHCGVCDYKNMLRQEVADHCAKMHSCKFQFKCFYCPLRSSYMENVLKHCTSFHSDMPKRIFYYYYREGWHYPNQVDDEPLWKQQAAHTKNRAQLGDGKEDSSPSTSSVDGPDLSLVKTEPVLEGSVPPTNKFTEFCDPSGLKFLCALCKVATEDDKEAMRSHLYEELKYRRWGCNLCPYKAFHKQGLKEHFQSEHIGQPLNGVELDADLDIEIWVNNLLDHQEKIINKAREDTITIPPPVVQETQGATIEPLVKSKEILEKAFGSFGAPIDMMFACPKCDFKVKDEAKMQDHLEIELNKVRWCCSGCTEKFQNYHQAQFHCKSAHPGQGTRATEAIRDNSVRNAWIAAVLQVQRLSMNVMPVSSPNLQLPSSKEQDTQENSLLVVRYEKSVPIPENTMPIQDVSKFAPDPVRQIQESSLSKRKRPTYDNESDEDFTPSGQEKKRTRHMCPYCSSYVPLLDLHSHISKHYSLKPYKCLYCDFTEEKHVIYDHLAVYHPNKPRRSVKVQLPLHPPVLPEQITTTSQTSTTTSIAEKQPLMCLLCEKILINPAYHEHFVCKPQLATVGDEVLKCCHCFVLRKNESAMKDHHNTCHSFLELSFVYVKMKPGLIVERRVSVCKSPRCDKIFYTTENLEQHHRLRHGTGQPKYALIPFKITDNVDNNYHRIESMLYETAPSNVAKKSTTKLPRTYNLAKKSTTKLPMDYETSEYSYYGNKPQPLSEFSNITTNMPFMNTVMPFSINQLKDILKIEPQLTIQDFRKQKK